MPKLICIMNPEDEDDLIEAEIQQQLRSLAPETNETSQNDFQDNPDEVEVVGMELTELNNEDTSMPDSIQRYLNMVNQRSEGLQKDLEECDTLLKDTQQVGSDEFYYQSSQMQELAFILGEDPEELRDRVLTEVEEEERKESEYVQESDPASDLTVEPVEYTASSPAQHQTLQTTGDMITNAVDSEQKAWLDLLKLDGKLKQRQLDMQQDTQREIQQQTSRDLLKDQTRSANLKQHAQEMKLMQHNRQIVEAKVEQELELETKKIQEVLTKHQADIEKLAKETEEERLEFERHLVADREMKQKQRLHAATVLQAAVRSYRVRKKYISRLNRLREERHQRQLQNRQMEIVALRRAEEQRKKREREERKKKEEEERRKKEEIQRKKVEEKQKQERLEKERMEQERKQKEMLDKQKEEEDKQRRDQQQKQERELEERTQEILSKIQNEGSFSSGVSDEIPTKTETMSNDEAIQNTQVVFMTNTDQILTATEHQYSESEMNTNDHANNSAETSKFLTSKDTSETTVLVNLGTDTLLHSQETTSPSQDSGDPSPTDSPANLDLAETDKTAATGLQNASPTSLSESTDVYPDSKQVVIDSDDGDISAPVVNEKIKAAQDLLHQGSSASPTLAADIEARRLQWIQNCVSYRSVVDGLRCTEKRRALRRVHGANKLPALTSSQLLTASQPATQLSQVRMVMVENSAPCSLSSLASCPHLVCLHLHHCGIMLLEGLDHCLDIAYIDLQHNKIEGINCRDRTQLKQAMLQDNKLTSSYGLEGCTQLRYLQLSKNSITRTGGLESLVNLTHLDLSQNQLVSIHGLGQLAHLTHLNLSHNHLSSVQDLQTCCLLQSLNIESNSLVEMPPLQNHVLLNELRLDDNSISSIVALSQAWLPLLQHVSIAQNGLSDLPNMKYCLMMRKFDVSHNCITDLDVIVDGLRECNHLEELSLEGNPVTQEDQYRSTVLGTLRWLHVLDDDAVIKPSSIPSIRTPLEGMCASQLHVQQQLHLAYQQCAESVTGDCASDILQACQARDAYMESRLEQAIRHRCMHEAGDMTHSQQVSSGMQQYLAMQRNKEQRRDVSSTLSSDEGDRTDSQPKITQSHPSPTDSVHRLAGKHAHDDCVQMASYAQEPTDDQPQTTADVPGNPPQSVVGINVPAHKESTTPSSIGPAVKVSSSPQHPISHAATVIQARWRGYSVRRDLDTHTKQYVAALRIQTLWRGYRVRKMVALARQAVRYHDSEEEEEEEALWNDEIDPTSWDVAQANVDTDWLPSETACIPRSHPCVPPTNKAWSSPQAVHPHDLPEPPRQAWYASPTPSPSRPATLHLVSKPPIPPVHSSPASDTPRTTKSHKQDQITEEWGFKDATTAELMMKRAKKLSKGSSTYKKKTLDPLQRYQQMKKVHDSARVVPAPKRGVQRQEFFQAREQEIQKAITAQKKEKEHKEARTFQWVHSHTAVHDDTMQDSSRHSSSEPNLPAISPQALQGRVQLMASPLLEVQSVDGASSVSSVSHRPRSQSLSAQSHEELRLPAIKTNSAPSGRSRERPAVGGHRNALRGWTSKR